MSQPRTLEQLAQEIRSEVERENEQRSRRERQIIDAAVHWARNFEDDPSEVFAAESWDLYEAVKAAGLLE